ncbi:hypothetical protein [Tabrizicola sp. M-4]|uniref:hypothetical protein n=1 Tax=Tabrizicola sp. M-4 TaxID=3055847 RepID=UPI003DA82DFA
MLLSFLSTVLTSLIIGLLLVILRRIFRMQRSLGVDLGLTAVGGGMLLLLHLVSPDLFGLDPWYGLGFELAKHGLELLVILLLLVAT